MIQPAQNQVKITFTEATLNPHYHRYKMICWTVFCRKTEDAVTTTLNSGCEQTNSLKDKTDTAYSEVLDYVLAITLVAVKY